ncbi:MAG: DNA-binding protein [Christensenellaceae bacterium]|jgi:predicted DNA-binding protein YlxM (UPF0122 family)|nr:DNA-binding protein [Christensenellaceae bacterium]
MNVKENLECGLLFEIYKSLLTNKQQEILSYFLNRDISISEIAISVDSTRQAVNDIIKRTLKTLEQYEKKLKILEKFKKMQQEIEKLEVISKKHTEIKDLEQITKKLDKINLI